MSFMWSLPWVVNANERIMDKFSGANPRRNPAQGKFRFSLSIHQPAFFAADLRGKMRENFSMPIARKFRPLCNALLLLVTPAVHANNYDEAAVGDYVLPDPLVCTDGTAVTNAETWFTLRRPEILASYREKIFGHRPGAGTNVTFTVWEKSTNALGGRAVRKQVEINFSGTPAGPFTHLLLYTPAGRPAAPTFLCLSFTSGYTAIADPDVAILPQWNWRTSTFGMPTNPVRGELARNCKISETLARGYGIALLHYTEIEPDMAAGVKYGVRKNFPPPAMNDWGAIAAWSWGTSRALDYLITDQDVNAAQVLLFGFSRLGKTALWTGAEDPRFAAVIANCSGEMGAALSRRDYGETVSDIAKRFPYWMAGNFLQFSNRAAALPVDSHFLLSLIAPRPLFLNTGSDDKWSDPRGEFLAAQAAAPVYALLGKTGITETNFPRLGEPLRHDVWFRCRAGKHDVLPEDWDAFLDFADAVFSEKH